MTDSTKSLEPDEIVGRVLRYVRARDLFGPGPVVAAVSGGQDSIAMLDVLRRIAPETGIELRVAHLNHMFRGAQAEEDAEFVRGIAREWGLPVEVAAIDVPAYRARHRLSKQVAARYARYQFLASAAARWGASRIAVGHTADDAVETLLLNLLRGAGLAGLAGMAPSRPLRAGQLGQPLAAGDWASPGTGSAERGPVFHQHPLPMGEGWGEGDPRAAGDEPPPYGSTPTSGTGGALLVVRPMLEVFRAETEAYCRARSLPFRSDPSNVDVAYRRNWVREDLLPALAQRVPGAAQRLLSAAELLADDYDIVRSEVERLWRAAARVGEGRVEFGLAEWRGLSGASQRHLLRRAVEAVAGDLEELERIHVDAAREVIRRGSVGAGIDLPRGVRLETGYNTFWVTGPAARRIAGVRPLDTPVPLPVPGVAELPTGRIEASLESPGGDALDRCESGAGRVACLDADFAGGALEVRSRRPGDRFVPFGMAEPKKLHDFFVDQKVPRSARDAVPIIARPDAIVWVAGYRIDDRFKVTPDTRRILVLKYKGMGDRG